MVRINYVFFFCLSTVTPEIGIPLLSLPDPDSFLNDVNYVFRISEKTNTKMFAKYLTSRLEFSYLPYDH